MQIDNKRIVINPRYRLALFQEKKPLALLLDELRPFVLFDEIIIKTLRLLNEGYTFPELYEKLIGVVDPHHLAGIVTRLLELGIIEFKDVVYDTLSDRLAEVDSTFSTSYNILLNRLNIKPRIASFKLRNFFVTIISKVEASTEGLSQVLRESGIQVASGDQPRKRSDLYILVASNYLSPFVSDTLEWIIAEGSPCLLFSPVGQDIFIGPLFKGRNICWSCLKRALEFQNPLYKFLRPRKSKNDTLTPRAGFSTPSLRYGYARVALDVARLAIQGEHSQLERHIVSFNIHSCQLKEHPITQLLPCDACRSRQPVVERHLPQDQLLATPLSQIRDFTASLEQAYAQLQIITSPISGIISSIQALPCDYAKGIFSMCAAQYRLFHEYKSLPEILLYGQRQSSAIGRSVLEASVKAGFEAIEHYSCSYQGYEYGVMKTFEEINQTAVHPSSLLHFSDRQYEKVESRQTNSSHGAFFVPPRFDPDTPIYWCPAHNVTRNQTCWVPMAYCYYGFRKDIMPVALADSNGTAAGPDVAFCFRNGLFELIQRDAVAIWHYNMLEKQGVDVSSWNDPYLDQLVGIHQQLDRNLEVLDIRSDLPLFVFAALSIDEKSKTLVQGFGAHHEPRTALRCALEECCQMLPNVVNLHFSSVSGISASKNQPVSVLFSNDPKTISSSPAVMPVQPHHRAYQNASRLVKKDFDPSWATCTINDLICTLSDGGIEVLFQDVQRPETGIPVLRVIAPGLRSWYPRLGPGRLYQVPVSCGELSAPKDEAGMNAAPILF